MSLTLHEIFETLHMVRDAHLDIRTVTLGLNLQDCAGPDPARVADRVATRIRERAARLKAESRALSREYGVPIVNARVAVTPVANLMQEPSEADFLNLARAMDAAAREVGVDFLGGFSALVEKGTTRAEETYLAALPTVLAETERVCASVNVASTHAGIHMGAVARMGRVIVDAARRTADRDGLACAKLVTFANAVNDNPFMAGAFHGFGEPECTVNVGISGPGVVARALDRVPDGDLGVVAETIKRAAFQITRAGELVGRELSRRLGVEFGVLDLSLAPTNTVGDSVGEILEKIGLERVGGHGTTAALAMLNDAVKKGGAFASSYVGGLSGAFIPVSEDTVMCRAAEEGALTLDKLEAMTSVCSVGLDMVAVPGDTPAETLSAIIADEAAIGMINNKTTAVRIIPVPGKGVGEMARFGGLLGEAPIIAVHASSAAKLIRRGGRIPAPLNGLKN
ncbi:MAG: PFL family protein [Nitrospirota bacterium]|nr:PFL family protein [Nitrospirota bacterium]